jgi:hypothetical protein
MAKKPSAHGDRPHWPSIEEQLRASKVERGSALEKLILENQGFEMLRPDEAHDKLRLPPWIRVYWRKLHPEAKYSGASGGYPMVLKELYEWMIHHQDLPAPPVPKEGESKAGKPGLQSGEKGKKGG